MSTLNFRRGAAFAMIGAVLAGVGAQTVHAQDPGTQPPPKAPAEGAPESAPPTAASPSQQTPPPPSAEAQGEGQGEANAPEAPPEPPALPVPPADVSESNAPPSSETAEAVPGEPASVVQYEPAPPDASEPDAAPELAAVVVSARRLEGDGTVADRPTDSVYGTRTTVVETPRSISQVSGRQLKNDVVRSADDLVRYAPGVTRGGGQNVNIAPQIRGQNSEVFQDGQRIYSVRRPINMNAYEAADIVAGVPSVVFGPITSSGGYVNYVTKKPRFGEYETEISYRQGAYSPRGSWNDQQFNVDTNQAIGKNFAYRASVTINRADDWYYNVKNNWNAFYGALAWKPLARLRVDWNASYDDYYNYNITHGWNRITQDLVDSHGKKYNAGRATPIINSPGVGLWSPVFESGARDSEIIGWQLREKNAEGKFVPVGPVNTTPLPTASPDTPGTLQGWVYDPSIPGNRVTKISPRRGHRAEDQNTSLRVQTQANIFYEVTRDLSLNNKLLASHSTDKNDSVGSFLTQGWHNLIDNRTELRNHAEYRPLGLSVIHDSNTGVAVRREEYESLAANNSFNINPYDLTQDSKYKTPGYLLGIDHAGASGSWIGQAGVPQETTFGYLNLPPMYPVKNGLYAEKGGFPPGGAVYTSKGNFRIVTLHTQQNVTVEDFVGINGGFRKSYITAEIENPVVIDRTTDKLKDEGTFHNHGIQLSPFIKPLPNITVYYTYDRSDALNTGGFYNVLTWGPGNRLSKLAFESVSKLHEVGVKSDIVPDRLFASLAGFTSARDQAPDINGNMARLETTGVEASLRYSPFRNLRTGVNLTWLRAEYTYIVPAGFSPYGFVPDNATVWGDRNVLNQRTGTKYDAAGIPEYSATGYVDYSFDFGLGAQLSGWVTSDWYVNLAENVKVPTQYNLDLNVYYRRPRWDVTLAITNLTDAKNFVNGLAGSTTEFLQPMRPLAVQGRVAARF